MGSFMDSFKGSFYGLLSGQRKHQGQESGALGMRGSEFSQLGLKLKGLIFFKKRIG